MLRGEVLLLQRWISGLLELVFVDEEVLLLASRLVIEEFECDWDALRRDFRG